MTRKQTFFIQFAALTTLLVSSSFSAEQAKSTRDTSSPSAFQLAKEGNRYIGEQAKDKVVQIRSERSKGGVTPSVWYVVYFDNTAALKATEVKFGNGKMLDVKRPLRLLSATSKQSEPLPKEKLKIDSDQALKIATQQPGFEGVTLKSSEMRLERNRNDEPVWRIGLWGSGLRAPEFETSLGDITIAAADGNVVENDLKPEKVR
jgi:hypothetical protein